MKKSGIQNILHKLEVASTDKNISENVKSVINEAVEELERVDRLYMNTLEDFQEYIEWHNDCKCYMCVKMITKGYAGK